MLVLDLFDKMGLEGIDFDHYNDGKHPAANQKNEDKEWRLKHFRSLLHRYCNKLLDLVEKNVVGIIP